MNAGGRRAGPAKNFCRTAAPAGKDSPRRQRIIFNSSTPAPTNGDSSLSLPARLGPAQSGRLGGIERCGGGGAVLRHRAIPHARRTSGTNADLASAEGRQMSPPPDCYPARSPSSQPHSRTGWRARSCAPDGQIESNKGPARRLEIAGSNRTGGLGAQLAACWPRPWWSGAGFALICMARYDSARRRRRAAR